MYRRDKFTTKYKILLQNLIKFCILISTKFYYQILSSITGRDGRLCKIIETIIMSAIITIIMIITHFLFVI